MASIREYFDYLGADDALCKICKIHVSRSTGNTTNIKKHLTKNHPEQWSKLAALEKTKTEKRKADETKLMMDQTSIKRFLPNVSNDTLRPASSSCSQSSSTVGSTATPSCSSSISLGDQSTLRQSLWREKGPMTEKADRALAQLIAGANLPLSIVEHPAFKNFINILAPSYKLKTRRTLNDKSISDLCTEYERKIKQELTQADAISLTTDGWTSKNGKHSVLSLTARYISKGTGEPIIRYAAVLPIQGRHTSVHISSIISNAIRFYDMDLSKIHLIIRDAASNMVCAMNILGVNSLDCFAHKMQLAVKEGLSRLGNLEGIIEKVKKIIRKLRKSGVDMDKFHEFQEESGLKPLQLIKGIEVRWNSMHDMLVRFIKNKAALQLFLVTNDEYPEFSDTEWDTVELVINVLKPIYSATMVVQERRASIATILPLYLALRELPTPDKNLAGVQRAIIKGLDSRMIGWDESEHLVIATLLDPRIKMACFPEDKRATFKDMLLRTATEVSQEAHGTVSETSSDSDINEDSPFAAFMQIYGGNREIGPQEPIDMDAKLKALYEVEEYLSSKPIFIRIRTITGTIRSIKH